MSSHYSESGTNDSSSITLKEAIQTWAKIGFLSFGGPAAQIALMHTILVEQKRWLSEQQYLNALSFCMLLPGPEAMQLATYSGWRLHGTLGGLIAGLLFVAPGALVVLVFAVIYAFYGDIPLISSLFIGIKATVLVIVVEALLKVSKRALNGKIYWGIAIASFIGIFFISLPFPLIIFCAALIGLFTASLTPSFAASGQSTSSKQKAGLQAPNNPGRPKRSWRNFIQTLVVWLSIWIAPLILIDQLFSHSILFEIGLFFSNLAIVTFGGAYAVLAYMGQEVVNQYGWLGAGEMMDGLGLAETTPGPLILVTEFVGFIAGYRESGIGMGFAAAIITLWTTFVPCFLWIFVGAPHIEWICAQPRLKGALTAISAAVVGVILNLSLWFALHVLFAEVSLKHYGILTIWQPVLDSINFNVIALVLLCGILIFRLHFSIFRVLLISSLLGIVLN